ncbi:MAG: sulfatase-like hydrolase/transferase [Nitrospiraceae bacterium]|nr:sulfatase-like hydrolase/transferase [Nitrospiraceae bacterium]
MHSISRRHFLSRSAAAAAALALSSGCATSAPRQESKPNILVILTDDQRYDTLSCNGHPYLKTPNLDALAKGGVCFDKAFVTLSLCSPARATSLTGQYAHIHGVIGNRRWEVPYTSPYIPPLMQEAGYVTAAIGKWHMHRDLADKRRPGFDHWAVFDNQGTYNDVTLNINGTRVKQSGHTTDVLASQLIDFLKQDRQGKPFFAWLGTKAAHGDYVPAERFKHLFDDVDLPVPPLDAADQAGKPAFIRALAKRERSKERGRWGIPPMSSDDIYGGKVRGYWGTIAGIDDNVGRIVEHLRKSGELENTVILFLSDGGHYLGEHGLWDKRSCYEESLRIPFIVSDGRRTRRKTHRIDDLVLNIDLAPTILALAGVERPPSMQGTSLVSLLEDGQQPWRSDFLFEWFNEASNPARMQREIQGVRNERWKYIRTSDEEVPEELYDLKTDPKELRNLVADARHADVLQGLRKRLVELQEETRLPMEARLSPGS